jgi:hypothetical protein
VDHASRSWRDRVVLAERLAGDERYDATAYLELLARAAETLLAPLGVTRANLLARWRTWTPRERPPRAYRSLEAIPQRRLMPAAAPD